MQSAWTRCAAHSFESSLVLRPTARSQPAKAWSVLPVVEGDAAAMAMM